MSAAESHVEWNDDYVQVMADWLTGFDMPYGCYDDPAATDPDGTLAWPQELGWEVRECIVLSVKVAIERAVWGDER